MAAFFEFKQCVILLKSTGKKARTLAELREQIAAIGEGSLFHHIYHYFLKGHAQEYTNDFSHWAGESIEERVLAERLSNLDPYEHHGIEPLRQELLRIIDAFRESFPEPREALPRDEFFFNEAVTIVFPAGLRSQNLAEFLMALKHVDASSLYYHFYDSRIRQGGRNNDFSRWLEDQLGKPELAGRIRSIDPFMHGLEGIREHILTAVEEEVKTDMESAGIRT